MLICAGSTGGTLASVLLLVVAAVSASGVSVGSPATLIGAAVVTTEEGVLVTVTLPALIVLRAICVLVAASATPAAMIAAWVTVPLLFWLMVVAASAICWAVAV